MKYILTLALFVSFQAVSQQVIQNAMYWNNYSFYNPAMSGVANKYEANAIFRNQWDKVNGSPNALFVNYGMNLANKHGLGFNYLYETIGNIRLNQLKLNYNYQLHLDPEQKLVFGTALTYQHMGWNPNWNPPGTGNDPALVPPTDLNLFNLDLGVSYYGKNIIAGVSAIQLPIYSNSNQYTTRTHLYGNVRYHQPLSSSSNYLVLETQLRTDFVGYSQDFNVGFNWKNKIEAGLGYRTSDAVLVNATGILADKYRVGYSYGITINKLSSISRGTHEIAIGLRIPNK